jgi:hypothetical protein
LALTSPDAALSGWDAARSFGIGSRVPPSEEVLVLDLQGRHRLVGCVRIRPTRRPFIRRTTSANHPVLPSMPIVDAARAIGDSALLHTALAPVRAMVTASVQRGICTANDLGAVLDDAPRNDSAHFRRALDDILNGARSIAEAEAVDWLLTAEVPPFELNVPILDGRGIVIAVADALWRELRAVLEVDSAEFHFSEPDWKRTIRRHNRLTAAGLALAHYPPSEIRAGRTGWAIEVEEWLRHRAQELGMPYRPGAGVVRPGSDGPQPYRLTQQS